MVIDQSKPVLVTGATGYVAGRLVEKLLLEGKIVHAAVRDSGNKEKTKYLDALSEKLPGTIKYFNADLLKEGSYDEAMEGCELVFHTASPFITNVKDPQKDLLDPAKKGTRNVLDSVNRIESVKRVVLTSSVVAIYGDPKELLNLPNQEISEENWNSTSSLNYQSYSFSKAEAEKEAWKIQKAQNRWDLVCVNPSFVLGPGINPKGTSESYSFMKRIAKGDFKIGSPEIYFGCNDVRDLAEAHYNCGYMPNANGRYIISGHNSSVIEVLDIIKKKFPNYKISTRKIPKWIIWLVAPFVGLSRKEILTTVGYPIKANNSKSIKELKINYRPLEESVIDFFSDLLESGAIPKK